jgi:hypothetical protein
VKKGELKKNKKEEEKEMHRKEIINKVNEIFDVNKYDKLLANNSFRSDFIDNISNYRFDKNLLIDCIFVGLQKGRGVDFDTDLIKLAMLIDVFSEKIFNILIKILYNKKSYLTKLISLDYINFYFEYIDIKIYKEITEYCLLRTSSNMLKFQLFINYSILPSIDKNIIIREIFMILKHESNPTLFYRFNYNILYFKQFYFLKSIVLDDYKGIIMGMHLNKEVKRELLLEL